MTFSSDSLSQSPATNFTGQERDRATGLSYHSARYYDPRLGRWPSVDPLFLRNPEKGIESPLEANLYGYAANNPVAFTDPAGLAIYNIAIKGQGVNIFGHNITLHVDDNTKVATFYEVTGPSPSAANVYKRSESDFVEHYREHLPGIDTPDFDPASSVGKDYDVVEVVGVDEEAALSYLNISAELFSPDEGPFFPYRPLHDNCATFSHEAYRTGGREFTPEPGNLGENPTRYPRDLQQAIRHHNQQQAKAEQQNGEQPPPAEQQNDES
jgi:RHS repeat-associated protein